MIGWWSILSLQHTVADVCIYLDIKNLGVYLNWYTPKFLRLWGILF